MKCYDVVQVVAIRENRFHGTKVWHQRHPQVGDRGTILEEYRTPEPGFEVECSDSEGITIWLDAMYPDELTVIWEYKPHET